MVSIAGRLQVSPLTGHLPFRVIGFKINQFFEKSEIKPEMAKIEDIRVSNGYRENQKEALKKSIGIGYKQCL